MENGRTQIYYIYLFSFFTVLVVHTFLWRLIPLVDYDGWALRVAAFSKGNFVPFQIPLFTNPDMAVVSLGALAYTLGAPVFGALTGSLILLTALGISSIITILYVLRPSSWWWLIAGISLIFHETYIESTPHDVVASVYIVLCYLIALYLLERRPHHMGWFIGLGVASGIVLATYLSIGILFLIPLLFFIAYFVHFKQTVTAVLTSVFTLFLFDPLWILMPITHAQLMIAQTLTHAAHFIPSPLPFVDFFMVAPLSLLGLFLGIIYVPSNLPSPLPRSYLHYVILTSFFISFILMSADYKTFRSFHPLFFLWSMFLPIFFLDLIQQIHNRRSYIKRNPAFVAGIFLIVIQLSLFIIAVGKTI